MRPLLLANRGYTIGGGEIGLELLVRGLLERGVEPAVVLPTPGPLLEGLPIDRHVSSPSELELTLRRTASGCGVLHTYSVGGYSVAQSAATGLPLVLHALVPNPTSADPMIGETADTIVCNSHATARRFPASTRTVVLHNGVPQPSAVDRSESIADPALMTIALIGPISARKGQLDALPALVELVERRTDVEVLFVGRASGPLALRLRHAVAEQPRMRLTGFVPNVSNHMPWFDLVLVPSMSEGFGRMAAEALRAGVPVLARPIEGLLEVLDCLDDPWLPADPTLWADRIEAELDRPRHSATQLRGFGARFDVDEWVDGIIDVWRRVGAAG